MKLNRLGLSSLMRTPFSTSFEPHVRDVDAVARGMAAHLWSLAWSRDDTVLMVAVWASLLSHCAELAR